MEKLADRTLISVIGDEDTVTGILLAGVGNIDPIKQKSNFLVVDNKTTSIQTILDTFLDLCHRRDVAIILINQHVAEEIRDTIDQQQQNNAFPVVLEIPSKQHPYDPEKDGILKRIQKLFGSD